MLAVFTSVSPESPAAFHLLKQKQNNKPRNSQCKFTVLLLHFASHSDPPGGSLGVYYLTSWRSCSSLWDIVFHPIGLWCTTDVNMTAQERLWLQMPRSYSEWKSTFRKGKVVWTPSIAGSGTAAARLRCWNTGEICSCDGGAPHCKGYLKADVYPFPHATNPVAVFQANTGSAAGTPVKRSCFLWKTQ